MGFSRYRELARGQIAGDSYGMLKQLVSTDDLKLVHIGQVVTGCDATIEYLVDAVFDYPSSLAYLWTGVNKEDLCGFGRSSRELRWLARFEANASCGLVLDRRTKVE